MTDDIDSPAPPETPAHPLDSAPDTTPDLMPDLTPAVMRQMMAAALEGDILAANTEVATDVLERQAQMLDILFHRLVTKAVTSPYKNRNSTSKNTYMDDARLDLALRTQRQCRNTLGSVQFLKMLQEGKNGRQKNTGKSKPENAEKNFLSEQTNDEA